MRLSLIAKTLSRPLLAFCALALLAGCDAMMPSGAPVVTPIATEPDIVTVKLAQAADKASGALDTIAGIDKQRNPLPPPEDYSNAPANLMQPVSLRWSGGIEPVAKALADRAGMKFRVKGAVPAVPLVVTVDAYQAPIIHILRDIGLQAGHRADLAIDTMAGVVELRYAPADRSR